MNKAEAIERLEYLKAKAQLVLEQEMPEWVADDILDTIEAYDMAIEALQIEPNNSEKPNNCEDDKCNNCIHMVFDGYWYCECRECKYEPKDEPQTDCAWMKGE